MRTISAVPIHMHVKAVVSWPPWLLAVVKAMPPIFPTSLPLHEKRINKRHIQILCIKDKTLTLARDYRWRPRMPSIGHTIRGVSCHGMYNLNSLKSLPYCRSGSVRQTCKHRALPTDAGL